MRQYGAETCPIRVMSFNVRGSFHEGDGINAWNNRAVLNVETIGRHAPDLIGFQELQSGNLEAYREALPEYDYVLGPRYGPKPPHDFNAIFFDPARLHATDSGGFWLSTTPGEFSRSWRTSVVRSVNWVAFRCRRTGSSFLHFNTHLDHVSKHARIEGSNLLLRKIAEIQEEQADTPPAVVTGDFNCAPGSPPYRRFTEDGFLDTYLAAGNEETEEAYTFHAFKGSRYQSTRRGRGSMRIDWILLQDRPPRVRAKSQLIVRDCDDEAGIYPSDHYPVLAELALTSQNGKMSSAKPAKGVSFLPGGSGVS